MINVGDTIIVTDKGCTYSSYDTMADAMELKNWRCGNVPKVGQKYKVVVVVHRVIGIQDNLNHQYLIDEEGVELVKKAHLTLKQAMEQ